jgi:hypothetical protein
MEIDRRALIASLGGASAVHLLGAEAKADALEDYLSEALDAEVEAQQEGAAAPPAKKYPTVEELQSQVETRGFRRGVGSLFIAGQPNPLGERTETGAGSAHVRRLAPMPANPTLLDFYKLRFAPANHVLQSATRAMQTGMSEEIIFACLLHDVVQTLIKPDHGWWGAQLVEPYVSEKVTFAIRYHQALRFYPDSSAGYEYPDLYKRVWGEDYTPPPYIEATYKYVRNHKWYMEPRLVTVNDLYAFDPKAKVSVDPFVDIIGRQFKQPKQGLGYDNSPVAHMWRTIANPDFPL